MSKSVKIKECSFGQKDVTDLELPGNLKPILITSASIDGEPGYALTFPGMAEVIYCLEEDAKVYMDDTLTKVKGASTGEAQYVYANRIIGCCVSPKGTFAIMIAGAYDMLLGIKDPEPGEDFATIEDIKNIIRGAK